MGGRGFAGWRGIKGGKWDNCNSIINKIYFKKRNPMTSVLIKDRAAHRHTDEKAE